MFDDFTTWLGEKLSVVVGPGQTGFFESDGFGLNTIGLGPSFDSTKIHVPSLEAQGLPVVPPNVQQNEDDLRAWRLQNASAYNAVGLSVSEDGSKISNSGFDLLKGATLPNTLGGWSGIGGGGSGGGGLSLTTIFVGVAVLLGMILVIDLVKK